MDLLADLRYAVRLLRKTPVFTVAAIGTLALGIGANTTIFSLVQTVLLRPLPYQNPDQVVMVWEDATAAGFPRNTPAPGNYNDWRAMNRSFTDMAATGFAFANLTGDGAPEVVLGRRVTANFFSVLGVQPVLGRAFTAADDTSGARVVVISHALWQRRYGGDPGIVGRTISMSELLSAGDVKHEVIGVAPPSFVFISREIDYWVPMQFSPEEAATRRTHYLNVVARLKPGVSVEAADSDMRAIAKRLSEQYPETNRDLGRRGRPDPRTGARRHQGPGDRADDCGGRHRPHRLRQSRQPAPRPRVGAPRRVRGASLARRHAGTAGAAGARRSPVPVDRRRCAGSGDPGADHDVRRADRAGRTAGVHRVAPGLASARVCRRALDRDRSCCSAWGRRCNRRTPPPRRCCSSTPAAMPADGAARSATAWSCCRWRPRWCCSSPPA